MRVRLADSMRVTVRSRRPTVWLNRSRASLKLLSVAGNCPTSRAFCSSMSCIHRACVSADLTRSPTTGIAPTADGIREGSGFFATRD